MTVRNMEDPAPKQPKPQKPCRQIDHKSDWSDSEDGKDDQARSNSTDSQLGTSYAKHSVPLRCLNTYPKVLNLGQGQGKGKFPLGNWTSVVKGCGCRIDQSQTPPMQQEPERNIAVVALTDRIVHMNRVQTYEGDLTLSRPRNSLANWSWVDLGNNPNLPPMRHLVAKHSIKLEGLMGSFFSHLLLTCWTGKSYVAMQEIWVTENWAIYVDWSFCCCCCYCVMLLLFICNYRWTTTKLHSNNNNNENKNINPDISYWKLSNLCRLILLLLLLLLLLCNCIVAKQQNYTLNTCYCVILLLQQQNYTLKTTRTKRYIYIHFLFNYQ